ncbi:acetyltransferase [Salinarimonas rosea]|uniref:acetyltransferase n=1 Tax=Salinarimonas rosea TaxID=552063 RepID=UPI0003F522CB|nr:acetyltransferase [Salinarimonas rosea]
MTRPIVVFGAGEIAEVAAFYFERTLSRTVAAFTVDAAYLKEPTHFGRPVLPFEEVARRFDPAEHDGFVALSYARMNRVRADKVAAMRGAGYRLTSYVSPKANVFTDAIGDNCLILENNTVQPFTRIGENVVLWSGNHIGHHSIIEDNVFVSSHVVVSGSCRIGANSFLGVNVTVTDHVTIAPFTLAGAGVPIASDTEPEGVYVLPFSAEKRAVPSTRLKRL